MCSSPSEWTFEALCGAGFRFLRADQLLQLKQIRRFQELDESYFVKDGEKVRAVLMVSHCWENPGNPDPTGRQLAALQAFLRFFEDIRTEHASSLLGMVCEPFSTLGRFQAALLYSKMLLADSRPGTLPTAITAPSSTPGMMPKPLPEGSLRELAVWYDFMCLPQKDGDVDDRTQEELLTFRSCLLHIQDMIYSDLTHVLSLRWGDDDYNHRLWCAVEEGSPNADGFRQLRLRADCIGQDVDDNDLTLDPYADYGFKFGVEQLQRNAANGWIMIAASLHRNFKPIDTLGLFKPNLDPGPMDHIFLSLHHQLNPVSIGQTSSYSFDPVECISSLVESTGLRVTNGHDRIPIICIGMSLRYLARQDHGLSVLFRDISARFLSGEGTTLVLRQVSGVFLFFWSEAKDPVGRKERKTKTNIKNNHPSFNHPRSQSQRKRKRRKKEERRKKKEERRKKKIFCLLFLLHRPQEKKKKLEE